MPIAVKILIFAFLGFIIFSLGQGLFYMLNDRGKSDRTVNALTRRIGLSVILIIAIIIGMVTGIIPTNQDPLTGRSPLQQERRP